MHHAINDQFEHHVINDQFEHHVINEGSGTSGSGYGTSGYGLRGYVHGSAVNSLGLGSGVGHWQDMACDTNLRPKLDPVTRHADMVDMQT